MCTRNCAKHCISINFFNSDDKPVRSVCMYVCIIIILITEDMTEAQPGNVTSPKSRGY